MQIARKCHSSSALGNYIYVAGGLGSMGYTILSTIERLDVVRRDGWQVISAPYEHSIQPTSAAMMISLHHNERILILGGIGLYDHGFMFNAKTEKSVGILMPNSREFSSWGNQCALVGFETEDGSIRPNVIGLALDINTGILKLISYNTA